MRSERLRVVFGKIRDQQEAIDKLKTSDQTKKDLVRK